MLYPGGWFVFFKVHACVCVCVCVCAFSLKFVRVCVIIVRKPLSKDRSNRSSFSEELGESVTFELHVNIKDQVHRSMFCYYMCDKVNEKFLLNCSVFKDNSPFPNNTQGN